MTKTWVKELFLLSAVVACLGVSQVAAGQEQDAWQKDWQKFGEAIAPYALQGAIERKGDVIGFNRIFSKEVEWSGKLKGFYHNGVAKFLTLEMKPIRIPFRDGSTTEVSELSISCGVKENGCEGWSDELIGKEVLFRTKLRNRTRGLLPVVSVMDYNQADRRIEIQTYGAKLVRVVSE